MDDRWEELHESRAHSVGRGVEVELGGGMCRSLGEGDEVDGNLWTGGRFGCNCSNAGRFGAAERDVESAGDRGGCGGVEIPTR